MKASTAPNSPGAKAAADATDKALAQALADMERAAGKTLEDKARDAKALTKSALEQQEKANSAIKDVPDNKAAATAPNTPNAPNPNKEAQPQAPLAPHEVAKRDEAAAREEQAAREARKLNQALEGLKELAKDANPAAADAAVEARETTQKTELPQAMEQLAGDMKRLGTDNKDQKNQDSQKNAQTPAEAAKQGEQHAQTLKAVDKQLDNFVAEARNSLEERLKNMEESAKQAAESAKQLAEQNKSESDSQQQSESNNPSKSNKGNPSKIGEPKNNSETAKADDKNKPDPKRKNPDSKNPEAQTGEPNAKPGDKEAAEKSANEQLKKQLKKLQPKIERLEASAPEKVKMKEAMAALEQADQKNENASEKPGGPPQPGKKNMGGAAYQRVNQALESIAQGVMDRRERLIKARDIRPDEDEDAPREYRTLVERYYRALSEDVEDERK